MFLKMYKKEPDEYNLNLDRFAKLFEGIQWIKWSIFCYTPVSISV